MVESWVDQVSETMDVDLMPGEKDFSNAFMPQQPFNSCLFPSLIEKQRESINLVTNPHQFEINGINFLGTSGQNVRDMLLNSVTPKEHDKDEGTKCLYRLRQTLEMRHLCPTAPDTLRIYPFKESDPFILDSQKHQSNLNLGEFDNDENTEANTAANSNYTQVPNVYFVGTMQSYAEDLVLQHEGKSDKYLKLLSLPSFYDTHSLVLLDL